MAKTGVPAKNRIPPSRVKMLAKTPTAYFLTVYLIFLVGSLKILKSFHDCAMMIKTEPALKRSIPAVKKLIPGIRKTEPTRYVKVPKALKE